VLTAWHAVPAPGPVPAYNIFYNVTSDSNEVSRMAALYAVAKSNGTGKGADFHRLALPNRAG
jgi:ribose transport system substrate-binding protein